MSQIEQSTLSHTSETEAANGKKRGGFFRFGALSRALRAFAVPYACCAAIVLCTIALSHGAFGADLYRSFELLLDGAIFSALWLAFSTSMACATLILRKRPKKAIVILLYLLCFLLAAGYFAARHIWGMTRAFRAAESAKYLLIGAFLVCAVGLLGRGDARDRTRFAVRAALRAALSAAMVGVLFGGCVILLSAMETLLSLDVFMLVFDMAAVLYGLLLPLLIMPHLLPDAQETPYPKALRAFVTYGILPLLAALSTVFYLYLFQILASGQWPSNQVAPLVLFGSGVGLILLYFYGAIPDDPAARLFRRIYPPVWLLPVGMLFASAYIRIEAYGLTPERILILAIGVWTFAMLVYAFFAGKKFSSHVLPLTLSAVLVFCALCPGCNLYALSRRNQLRRLDAALEQAGMGTHEQVAAFPDASDETREAIFSAVRYLRDNTDIAVVGQNGIVYDGSNAQEVFGFDPHAYHSGRYEPTPAAREEKMYEHRTLVSESKAVNTKDSTCAFFGLYAQRDAYCLLGNEDMELVLADWTLELTTDDGLYAFDVAQAAQDAIRQSEQGNDAWYETQLCDGEFRVRISFETLSYEMDTQTNETTPESAVFTLVVLR